MKITSLYRRFLMNLWNDTKYSPEFKYTGNFLLTNKAVNDGMLEVVRKEYQGKRVFKWTEKACKYLND